MINLLRPQQEIINMTHDLLIVAPLHNSEDLLFELAEVRNNYPGTMPLPELKKLITTLNEFYQREKQLKTNDSY